MHNNDFRPGSRWIDWRSFFRDLVFSLRSLLRAKSFTLTAIITLALGMFLTVTVWIYSAWTMTSYATYPHPEEVYSLGFTTQTSADFAPFIIAPQLQAYREQLDIFTEVAAVCNEAANVVIDNEPVAAGVARLLEGSTKMLDLTPSLGRPFLPEEYRPGGDDVVILSFPFWKEHFHSDPHVLNRTVTIDEHICRVVGVFSEKQAFPIYFYQGIYRPWVPTLDPNNPFEWQMMALVRLKPGVKAEQVALALKTVKVAVSPGLSKWLEGQTISIRKPNELYRPEIFRLLFGAALFLFTIACLNTVNLMLVRVLGRNREFSIRRAIGGTQGQVVRLIIMEAAIISLSAGLLVFFCVGFFTPRVLELWTEYMGDRSLWGVWSAHKCLAALVGVSTLVLGATSAWRVKHTNISAGLKDSGPSAGESKRTGQGRNLLVMLQAAFAVVLLAGAGLMIRTFQNTARIDLGLDPNGKVNVMLAFPRSLQPTDEARLQTFNEIEEIFRRLPGVRAVGSGSGINFWGWSNQGGPSLRMPDGTLIGFSVTRVSEHFAEAAGLRLVKGRWMSQSKGAQEVVINESLAKNRFGDQNPIGQVMMIKNDGKDGKDWLWTVTGVVHDVRPGLRVKAMNEVYEISSWWAPGVSTLLLRYDKDPGPGNESLIRRAIYKSNPHVITMMVQTLNEQLKLSQSLERQALNILRWLSAVALALATIGLFSVLAYNVHQRRPEFGVRLALGAPPSNIVWLVLRRGLITAGIGVLVGCGAALGLTRLMASLLFETKTFEPVVYISVAAALLISAFAACWIPARRAAKVDVSRLLRME
jgi:putative ABC transport system permease protein